MLIGTPLPPPPQRCLYSRLNTSSSLSLFWGSSPVPWPFNWLCTGVFPACLFCILLRVTVTTDRTSPPGTDGRRGLSLAAQYHCPRKKVQGKKERVSTATKSRPWWQRHQLLWAHVTCGFQSLSPLSFPSITNIESSIPLTGNLANTSSLPPSHLLKPNLWSNPPTKIRCLSRDELSHSLRRHFLVLWLERMKN